MTQRQRTVRGKVYLVGAGPGAPGLITLRGVECLRCADVVLYDYLVNPRILVHARADAERICLKGTSGGRSWTQQEINAQTVEHALAGRTVVRLKGGDPAVFARGAAEIEALLQHQIPFEIVPGITAALAAGSYAAIPLTHREHASAVALVTGQETSSKASPEIDYASLARFPGTLVIYMGATTAPTWTRALMQGGMASDTPATIVRRCSFPDQQTRTCTLAEVEQQLTGSDRLRPPLVVIVGKVAGLPRVGNWFEERPLFGQTVLVTRPAEQAASLATQLEELGAEVLVQPAIAISAPQDWGPADAALDQLARFQWLVFSSANGVHAFMGRLFARGCDVRALGSLQVAAIGPATDDALRHYHVQADLVPTRYQAEDLAAALRSEAAGKRFLLVRASRGREVLGETLQAAGAEVVQAVFYDSSDLAVAEPEIVGAMWDGKVHWTTVTSSAIARSLTRLFPRELSRTRLASISPLTSDTLRQCGYEPAVEAREATMEGMVAAILEHEG